MRPKRGAMPQAATAGEAEEADRQGVAEGALDFEFGLKKVLPTTAAIHYNHSITF